jgi:hypothetical protein
VSGVQTAGAGLARVREALSRRGIAVPALAHDLTRVAAGLALLVYAGLVREEDLVAALSIARLPAVIAEGLAVRPGRLKRYPMDLPPFRYVEDPR